jgi:hypothetical protein
MNNKNYRKWYVVMIIGFVLGLCFLVFYPSSTGVSFYTKQSFYFSHHQNMYLNKIDYELISLRSTDQFGNFYKIELNSQKDVQSLESLFQSDSNINKYNSVQDDTYSLEVFNSIYENKDLPFDLECDCYTFYTINERSIDAGYLYQIFMVNKNIYIYFISR